MTDTRQVIQRYNQLVHYISPYCQSSTVPTEVCLQQFQSTLQYLTDFDQLFTLKFAYALRDYVIINPYQPVTGVALPGVASYQRYGSSFETQPNSTLLGGIALPNVYGADLHTFAGLGLQGLNFSGMGLSDMQSLLQELSNFLGYYGLGLPDVQYLLPGSDLPGLPNDEDLLQELANILGNYGLGLPDIQYLLSGLDLSSLLGVSDNTADMNMTELITALLNQSYFGGNLEENLAEVGSHPSSTPAGGRSSTASSQDARFSGYSSRKRRSLSPNQPERSGNKIAFWPDKLREAVLPGTNPNQNETSSNITNSDRNVTHAEGYRNKTSSNRPYLFNGRHYVNASIILSMINLTLSDLSVFLDQSIYGIYSDNKMTSCNQLQQSYTCLRNNIATHLQMMEPVRGFILENTLEVLMANSLEKCESKLTKSFLGCAK